MRPRFLWFLSLTAMFLNTAAADELVLPPADLDLVGAIRYTVTEHEDTLSDIARRYGLGRDELVDANPGVDPWLPGEGTRVLLPTRYILPDAPRQGIVLNLPEMRLYYFPPAAKGAERRLITHPISIGRMDWKTPLGTTRVASKEHNPSWRPPKSVRQEADEDGRVLPEIVPPGPDNPLGEYAMRLGVSGYLIHGTNKPYGVGMRVTHGCIRLYPEDIEQLFQQVAVSTPVHIVNQPIKLGWLADTLFVEVHLPLEEDVERRENLLRSALELVFAERERHPFVVDGAALKKAVEQHLGIPVPISRPADSDQEGMPPPSRRLPGSADHDPGADPHVATQPVDLLVGERDAPLGPIGRRVQVRIRLAQAVNADEAT